VSGWGMEGGEGYTTMRNGGLDSDDEMREEGMNEGRKESKADNEMKC